LQLLNAAPDSGRLFFSPGWFDLGDITGSFFLHLFSQRQRLQV
jgi:hypothetical protein